MSAENALTQLGRLYETARERVKARVSEGGKIVARKLVTRGNVL